MGTIHLIMRFLLPSILLLSLVSVSAQTRFVRAVNNIAELVSAQNNPAQVHTNIYVSGYYTEADGGGGMFEWIPGNASATNRGISFASKYPGSNGRFKRQVTGSLNTRMFGAGGGVNNDSLALQEAIDLASVSNNDLYFQPVPGGYLSGNLIARANLRIHGPASIIIAGTNWLSISNVINVDVRDVTVYPTSTNQVAFWLHDDAHDVSFRNVFVNGTLDWGNRAGWDGNGPYGWVINRSYINEWANCSAEFIGTDVWFNSDNSHRNTFNGCSFRNANKYNILASITGHGNNFNGCDIEGAPTFVRATDAEINLLSCYFEAHTNPYGIQIDGTSIVNIQDSYMNDTYVSMAGSSVAASLVLERNHWDGIGSSLSSPFIRYTQDSVSRIKLVNNNSTAAVVIYRTGQWWDGATWQNLSNNEEEIHDQNLIYDPVALITRRAYTSGPFLDSQKFNHPLGINHFPDNSVGLSIRSGQLPTNAPATALIALENTTLSAGYYMLGIDGTNQFVVRWSPNTNDNLINLANDGTYAGFPGSLGVGTLVPNLSPLEFAKALTIFSEGTNVVAGLEMRGTRTNTTPADFAAIKFFHDINAVAEITAFKDSTNDAGGLRFWTKATSSALNKSLELDSQGFVLLPTVPTGSALRTATNGAISPIVFGAGLTWDGMTLTAGTNSGGSASNAYSILMEEGAPVTGRTNLNFVGAGFTLTDDAANNRSQLTLLSGVGSNPTALVGTSAINGTSTNYIRADGAPAIDTFMNPTWYGLHIFSGATSNAIKFASVITNDSVTRFSVEAGGRVGWSPGNTALDTFLYRNAAGVLQLDSSLVLSNYFKRGLTNISTGAASFSAIGPNTVIWTNSASTTVAIIGLPTTGVQLFSFATIGNGVATNGFTCSTHTIDWQTSQITTPANGVLTSYDFWQVGTKLYAYANTAGGVNFTTGNGVTNIANVVSASLLAGTNTVLTTNSSGVIQINSTASSSFTTGAGVTNISNVLSWNSLAGTNIVFTTNANGVVSINSTASGSSSTNGFTYYQTVGTGTDFNYLTAADLYQKVNFGTTGPTFVITNAGTYQVLFTVATINSDTFPQTLYLTNVTDGVLVQGPFRSYNTSPNDEAWPVVFSFQITTTGANKTIELWGKTSDSTYSNAGIIASKTRLNVICLSCAGGSSGSGSYVDLTVSGTLTVGTINIDTLYLTNLLSRALITNGVPSQLVYNDGTGLLSSLGVGSGLSVVGTNLTATGGGSGIVGTVSNNVASAGLLAVDSTKTNGIAATLAHMTNALGLTGSTTTFLRSDGTQATPSGGGSDNWTASGTTNSTLAGIGSLHGLVVTNSVTIGSTNVTDELAGKQPLDSDLTAIAALTTTGIMSRTGAGNYATRDMQAGSNIVLSNSDGVAGNPSIATSQNPTFATVTATNGVKMTAGAVPSTPASGIVLYSDTTNHFGWIGTNGFTRIFDGTANTTDRIYTLPDKNGTVAMTSDIVAGTVGTMINTTTPVLYELYRAKDTTTTNVEPGNLFANGTSLKLGVDKATPDAQRLTAGAPTGANTVGANLTIAAPSGTGTGTGGSLLLGMSVAGSSSSVTNPTVTAITILQDAQIAAATETIVSGRLRVADGTASLPGIVFTSDDDASGTGFYRAGANTIGFAVNGTGVASLTSSLFTAPAGLDLSSPNMHLSQESTGILQLGTDSSTPVAQTVKGADGSGSTIVGGTMKIGPGRSTGGAVPAIVQVEVGTTGAATSTQNTYATPVGLGGTLKVDTTTTGNVGAGEDTLITYTIPAGELSLNGSSIEFRVWGTCAANTNTKDIKVYFGSTVLSDGGVTVLNGVSWSAHGFIVRTGAATQTATCELTAGVGVIAQSTTTSPTETLSGTVVFKVTGTSAISPADNDIVQNGMFLRWNPGQ